MYRLLTPTVHQLPLPRVEKASERVEKAQLFLVHAQNDLKEASDYQDKAQQLLKQHKIINLETISKWMPANLPQSYIFLCNPIDGIQSILNARAVVPQNPEFLVRCSETYGNTTKEVERAYPFSLKYVSSQTFEPSTRVVRDPAEACTWLHALDIVESIWD
jgi:hypothetical protein